MTLIELAAEALRVALKLYAAAGGPALTEAEWLALGRDSGVEIRRIDTQQEKDEAAENSLARQGGADGADGE